MIAIPRLVIAGTHSGVGKTTITTALLAAFTRRGLRVQPFKVGPDFIDPGFHLAASGRVSRNLDGWMLADVVNRDVFARAAGDADLAIVEGVMGLFDGRSASSDEGSTAQMAKLLGAPVLLVVDAGAMARSGAAVVRGFEDFDSELKLAGVLFNRVGGPRHVEMLREAMGAYCRSTAVGCLPRDAKISMPSRHLGLTLASEALTPEILAAMADWVEAHVDLDALLALARAHSPEFSEASPRPLGKGSSVRIGVGRDAAFCFYYQDNLDLLRHYGAELVEFSPMADDALPQGLSGIYLGGGYPELHAEALAENRAMQAAIRDFAQAGGPIYAECGGFMYLTEGIVDSGGREFPMVGLFPTRARMQSKRAALGYIEAKTAAGELWLRGDESLRGHEFRYSTMDAMPETVARVYQSPAEAYRVQAALGSYSHLHFLACPEFADRFVEYCAQWRAGKTS